MASLTHPLRLAEWAYALIAAFLATGQLEGYASITELIEAATMREVKRLQRKHNGGRKWEGVPAETLRPGRRTREETMRGHEGL